MEYPPPRNPDDLGRGPMIMGLTWTFTGLAIFATILRLYTRKRISPRLDAEDWLMVAALVFQLVNQSFATAAFSFGMGKHYPDLVFPDQVVPMFKYMWFAVPPGLLSGILGRISCCVFLIRLFGIHAWFKWYSIVLTSLGVIMNVVIAVCSFAAHDPVQSLWDPRIEDKSTWNPMAVQSMMFLGQSFYALADLTFVIIPIVIVWNLNMSLNKRLALIFIVALSLVTCAMSIMKGISAHSGQGGSDPSYSASLSLLWATLEQACVVLLGNLVPLRALANLEIPIVRTIADSMASLLGSGTRGGSMGGSRSGRSKSSTITGRSHGGGRYEDIEMGKGGGGGGSSVGGGTLRGSVKNYNNSDVWVKGNGSLHGGSSIGSKTLTHDGQVRRTDTFDVTYDSASGSIKP